MTTTLFTTVHGSHLYGLAHGFSDRDTYTVVLEDVDPLQVFNGLDDVFTIGLDRFLVYASSGSHQSVEAMFSREKRYTEAGMLYRPLFEGFRVGGGDVCAKYERTIRKFCYGSFKQRRHAVRLWWNLDSLRRFERFDPRMTPEQVTIATAWAEMMEGDVLREWLSIPASDESHVSEEAER